MFDHDVLRHRTAELANDFLGRDPALRGAGRDDRRATA
jgi:hypothetical protein